MPKFYGDQPPSGGCVLKPFSLNSAEEDVFQPPSGGCVLKPASWVSILLPHVSRLQAAVC